MAENLPDPDLRSGPMAAEHMEGRRLGGFELIELLGEGSYGSVWRARQVRLERDVAVKVLDPVVARDPTAARRFEREGRAAASLDHPAIVPVYEAGDDDGLYYLAMRLVSGTTLADVIDAEAPLDRRRVAELLGPIGDALDAAHRAGLIHRDVKPANILLEAEQPYLSDFGIAASAREIGRYTTGSIGTAEYMAPEQARGEEIDHRADLYALGCVAYHALTGVSPFRRDDVVSTLLAHTADPVPPTGHGDLDAFFARALAKKPADRFGSGTELVRALAGGAAVEPPPAHEAEPTGRRPVGWIVAAVVAVVAFVIAGVVVANRDDSGGTTDATVVATDPVASDPPVTDPVSTEPAGTEPVVPAPSDPPVTEPTATDPPAVRTGGNLAVGTTLELDDLNPHSNIDMSKVLGEWVLPVMYAVDTNLDANPSLALGPPVAEDGDPRSLLWAIRDDVVWDDGSRVTTADIEATWAYVSGAGSNATNLLLYETLTDVTAVDDTTVRLTFSEPNGAAYLLFSTIHPVIKASAWEDHLAGGGSAADFLVDGVDFSAGPYRLAPPRNEGEIELVPNPEWSGEPGPALERIEFSGFGSPEALIEALDVGQLDLIWVDTVDSDDFRDADAIAGVETVPGTSEFSVQLTFNSRSPILADPVVRQAIVLAIDRVGVADTAVGRKMDSIVDPLDSLVFLPGQRGNGSPFDIEQDRAAAADLLDAAGWVEPDGGGVRQREGQPLELDFALINTADNVNSAVAIDADLEELGFEVNSVPGTVDQVDARVAAGDFDLLLQVRIFNSDPIATGVVFGTGGCPAVIDGCNGTGVNVGAFSDAEVDAQLAAANEIVDPDERLAAYADIDQRLTDVVAAVPLFVRPAFAAHSDDVTGVVMAPNRGPLASLADWAFVAG